MMTLTLTISSDVDAVSQGGRKVGGWRDEQGDAFAEAFAAQGFYSIDWRRVARFGFSRESREIRAWPVLGVSAEVVSDVFSRLRPIILQALGWQALHASAAANATGAVAFCGKSHCGKSTLAFAMRGAGWRQLSDDALVLDIGAAGAKVCPLPFTTGLRPPSLSHFSNAHGSVSRLDAQTPEEAVPLKALFLLRQHPRLDLPRISPIARAQAFTAVLPHAHCFDEDDPNHMRRLVRDYFNLVDRVPIFALEYRPDFDRLPALIQAVEETMSSLETDAACSREARSLPVEA